MDRYSGDKRSTGGKSAREIKKRNKEEKLKRREAREARLRKRAEEEARRKEAIVNTLYEGDVSLMGNHTSKSYAQSRGRSRRPEFSTRKPSNMRKNVKTRKVVGGKGKPKGKKNPALKKRESFGKRFFRFIRRMLLLAILLGLIGGLLAYGYIMGYFGDSVGLDSSDLVLKNINTEIYDKDSKLIATLAADEKRKAVKLSDVSRFLPKAYVAIEDERFYSHPGIDFKRTVGATVGVVVKGNSSYGGSTITQQLIKNLTKDDSRSWKRKVREISRAIQLEKKITKDEILELYLNLIYVGGSNIHGVALGSDYYFAKSPKDLTLEESAFLAGINHMPAAYDIHIYSEDKKPKVMKRINKRTKIVLSKMKELGYITKEEYDKAVENVDKGLNFKKGKLAKATVRYTNIVDAAIKEATQMLIDQKGMTKELAKLSIQNGGYKIYTTQDSNLQKIAEKEMKNKRYILKSRKHKGETAESVMVITNHHNGNVVAAVGGLRDETTMIKGGWNRVIDTKKQIGSVMKPIGVMAPGLENKKLTAGSVFKDEEYKVGNVVYKNYNNRFQGNMSIRKAIEKSINIPNVKALEEVGINKSYEFLKKIGIQVTKKDKNIGSLALGGLIYGTTVTDVAGAYGMIANNGEYIKPHFVDKLVTRKGEELVSKDKKERVMSEQNSYILKDILKGVVERGTGTYAHISGFDVAGKTGTTNNDYDRWFAGFTEDYTAAVWFGFIKNETVRYGHLNPAGMIFANVMKEIHSDLKGKRFKKPDGIVSVKICKDSGLKVRSGGSGYYEIFAKGTEPTEYCKYSSTPKPKPKEKEEDEVDENAISKLRKLLSGLSIDEAGKSDISNMKSATRIYNSMNDATKAEVSSVIKAKVKRIPDRIKELEAKEEKPETKKPKKEKPKETKPPKTKKPKTDPPKTKKPEKED